MVAFVLESVTPVILQHFDVWKCYDKYSGLPLPHGSCMDPMPTMFLVFMSELSRACSQHQVQQLAK